MIKARFNLSCYVLFILLASWAPYLYSQGHDMQIDGSANVSSHIKSIYKKHSARKTIGSPVITVVIESYDLSHDINGIRQSGGEFKYKFGNKQEIRIPVNRLPDLTSRIHKSSYIRLPYPHKPLSVTSQGVGISGASDMHALNFSGQGVKVGVIDVGFAGYTSSQANGELPQSLTAVDYTGTGVGGSSHGTNVAEIIHDMAPGAELYLSKIGSIQQLQQALLDMQAAGVKVVNHSVAWFGVAFYDGTGALCDLASQLDSAGVQWVNAMGNSRNAHYLGSFVDNDLNLQHEFSSGNNYNTINVTQGASVSLVLNWDDYPTSRIDYNLHLYDGVPGSGGVVVASSTNPQSGPGRVPYESLAYVPAFTGTHYIVITRSSTSTAKIPLTLFSLGPALGTRVVSSSLTQPADCSTVLSVAAVNLEDNVESFSSEGPTTNGLNKPDVSATDRTLTSLSTSFAGTSGSSPHVAGAVALLVSRHPSYTPLQLRNEVITKALDVGVTGYDYRTGYGRISLDADMDLVNHDNDNCPLVANITQLNTDGDAYGNACDTDDDNDGLTDTFEIAIGSNTLLIDTDGDGLDDLFEVSYDGDPTSYVIGQDLNPLSRDSDNDSFADADDPLPLLFNFMDGDLAPVGNPDGVINIADYVIARRLLSGELSVTNSQLSHGDVYPPLLPDGQITASDVLLIYQKLLP